MTSPRSIQPAVLIASLVVGCLCALLIGAVAWSAHISQVYDNKILPNVSVAGIPVGKSSEAVADSTLRAELGPEKVKKITVQVQDRTYTLTADTADGSFVEPSATLVRKAFAVGRSSNPLKNTWDRIRLSLGGKTDIALAVDVDPERLRTTLEPKIQDVLRAPSDAKLTISTSTADVQITPEQRGISLDWEDAASRVEAHINRRVTGSVQLPLIEAVPNLVSEDLMTVRSIADQWLTKPPLALYSTSTSDTPWQLTTSTLASWISVTSTVPHEARIELNRTAAEQTFRTWLGTSIRAAQDGLLELDDQGKLVTFIAPKDGFGPDTDSTLERIQTAWDQNATSTELVVRVEQPTIRGDAERLGIRELIGRGSSNFSGSPTNRRKNIRLGMERVHGTIVPAGQEFSMMKTLGEIDGEHGWLPELVIKGHQTVPEYGGGLCQIGTTAFRGAMNTGLEITERRNHSYRVRYYEPAGTDATLYDPSPDFKFKNDTAHAVLITGEIRGDIVEFSFWGTSDGRKGSISPSRITKIVPAPPTKLIETTDLPVGTKKCTETAHAGATAQIDYTVEQANGEKKVVTFTSVYRPWQAVCLIGVASLSTQPAGAETVDQAGTNNLN